MNREHQVEVDGARFPPGDVRAMPVSNRRRRQLMRVPRAPTRSTGRFHYMEEEEAKRAAARRGLGTPRYICTGEYKWTSSLALAPCIELRETAKCLYTSRFGQ